MEAYFPLLFAAVVGFGHAFEADHLVAVSNIVTKRNRLGMAIKDGIFWGLGHSSTIFLIGLLMIVANVSILERSFKYFEAAVGLMLIFLGIYRMFRFFQRKDRDESVVSVKSNHHLAYGVGLIHGLAGSGAMILLVMTDIHGKLNSMLYLLIFGAGSIVGMLVAAGIFSLPFSKKMNANQRLQFGLVTLSSLLCIGYGSCVLIQNLS
jgi:cytochrome c biogenesis protein CcdA